MTFGSPADGDVPTWNDSTGKLVMAAPTGGGGGSPTGAAGGVLGGTYPNPGFAADMATQAEQDAAVAALSLVYQPLDSDLTAIAALTTTSFGRAFLALADAAAGRTALGLGTAATHATGDYDAAGAAAAAQAASQPLDSDLTAIAALTTTAFGRALLALADQAALLSAAGAAAAVHAHAGEDITSGTVADARIASTIARDSEVTSAVAAEASARDTAIGVETSARIAADALLVPKSLYDANTVLAATTDDTPAALTVAASTFVGRKASGNIAAMTATEAKAVLAIAESDVTSLTTDLAAKVPKSLFDANTVLAADTDDTPAAVTMGASTILARLAAGNIKAATPAELRTLLGLVIGTDVQAFDADLSTYAGITPSTLGQTLLALANAAAGRTALGLGALAVVPAFPYTVLIRSQGTLTGAAASGNKYVIDQLTNNSLALAIASGRGIPLLDFVAADYAITGLTSRMLLRGQVVVGASAPAVTITVGLYPVVISAGTYTLGTVVSGSPVAIASPGANAVTTGNSGAFTIPSDGVYALGAIVSGTPSGSVVVAGQLELQQS